MLHSWTYQAGRLQLVSAVQYHLLLSNNSTAHINPHPRTSKVYSVGKMAMAQERPLRILTLLTSALALPLLIATTVISLESPYWYSHRDVTAFCFGYIPLAMTAVASTVSMVHQRRRGTVPGPRFSILDGLAGIMYFAILIPIWAVEVGDLGAPGYGLLAGYTTSPMIVNM